MTARLHRRVHLFRSLAVAGALALLTGCRDAPPRKIGYVDTSQLLNNFGRARQVHAKLDTTTARWQAEVETRQQEIEALRERYVKEQAGLSAAAQQKRRAEMARKEQGLARFVQEGNRKAAALEAEKMGPVYKELNAILREYGARHGYYIIWGATPNGNIVYADSSSNLTDEILAYIQARNGPPEKASGK